MFRQQLRSQAKELHKAQKSGDPNAIRRIGEFHPRFSGLSQAEIAAAEIALADAGSNKLKQALPNCKLYL